MSTPFLLIAIVIIILVLLLLVALLQWLWNITMPELFNLPRLRYWQALRLMLITAILFGSPGIIRFGETRAPVDAMEQGSFND